MYFSCTLYQVLYKSRNLQKINSPILICKLNHFVFQPLLFQSIFFKKKGGGGLCSYANTTSHLRKISFPKRIGKKCFPLAKDLSLTLVELSRSIVKGKNRRRET